MNTLPSIVQHHMGQQYEHKHVAHLMHFALYSRHTGSVSTECSRKRRAFIMRILITYFLVEQDSTLTDAQGSGDRVAI